MAAKEVSVDAAVLSDLDGVFALNEDQKVEHRSAQRLAMGQLNVANFILAPIVNVEL